MVKQASWARHAVSRNFAGIACFTALISGCGSVQQHLRPAAPPLAVKTAKEAAMVLRKTSTEDTNSPASATAPNFDDMKAVVRALRSDIIAAAEQKNDQSWNANLVTLVGGTMATIGAVASRTGLTNTGVAVALLGLSSEQFYKPVNAIEVHLDADNKLLCIEDLTFGLNEAERVLAASSEFDGSAEARAAIDTLNDSLNGAMLAYRRSLLGIRPGTPTRDELLGFMKRFQADAKTAEDAGTRDLPSAEDAPKAAAAQKFIGLTTNLQACVKLGGPAPK